MRFRNAGHHKIVKLLQENGVDLNAVFETENNTITPLMFAVQYAGIMQQQSEPWVEHGAVIQILLRGGCDIALQDKQGRTALIFAAELGHADITQWLLEFEADAAAADVNAATPLMFAAKAGHLRVVQLLINAGAPLEAANVQGSTAMHFAAASGNVQVGLPSTTTQLTAVASADRSHHSVHAFVQHTGLECTTCKLTCNSCSLLLY